MGAAEKCCQQPPPRLVKRWGPNFRGAEGKPPLPPLMWLMGSPTYPLRCKGGDTASHCPLLASWVHAPKSPAWCPHAAHTEWQVSLGPGATRYTCTWGLAHVSCLEKSENIYSVEQPPWAGQEQIKSVHPFFGERSVNFPSATWKNKSCLSLLEGSCPKGLHAGARRLQK